MSILSELNTLLTPVLTVETGVFSGIPPDEYLVLTPMTDTFNLFGDDKPLIDTSEVRISLFSKDNYQQKKRQITTALLDAGFTITTAVTSDMRMTAVTTTSPSMWRKNMKRRNKHYGYNRT
jgi:hypothetical protein